MSNSRLLFGFRRAISSRPKVDSIPHDVSLTDLGISHLLQAYDLAQKHYDSDLQLFSARMNLFLLVQSALVTVTGSSILGGGDSQQNAYRGATSVFGLVLAVAWLFVAVSSYAWVKTWRAHMIALGTSLTEETSVLFSSALLIASPENLHIQKIIFGLWRRDFRGSSDRHWSHAAYHFFLLAGGFISVSAPIGAVFK